VAIAELLWLYVSSKTQVAQLIQSSLQHSTVEAVFLYVLLLSYLSLILILEELAFYLIFPLDLSPQTPRFTCRPVHMEVHVFTSVIQQKLLKYQLYFS